MHRRLEPRGAAGEKAVLLAEEHARELAAHVGERDRAGLLDRACFQKMADSGLLGACVPEELGGLGVTYLQDVAAVVNRIGYADAGMALAVHMHLGRQWYVARRWTWGTGAERAEFGAVLTAMGSGAMVAPGAASEAGTDWDHVLTEATEVDGGYLLNGRKTFVTLSAIATHFHIRARVPAGDGWEMASVRVDGSSPGVTVVPDWDAMGMRTSGSNDVVLTDVFVPTEAVSRRGTWGEPQPGTDEQRTVSAIGLQGAFLGGAEAARDFAVAKAAKGDRHPHSRRPSGLVHVLGEMDVRLMAARATLERALAVVDDGVAGRASGTVPAEVATDMMVAFQCAKDVVTHTAIDMVNRAMTVVGGGGFMSAHPLSRIYRDMRAGPLMQPYAPLEAMDFIGTVAIDRITRKTP
ncbi:acyl-CoA dehydrogenase family protein [Actinophytocola glycyrrhizae]|uniref:Acyl-CoA dehydrogenase family protein n=1 Tax=Actinophytocola glycyrrhizae TaxID=2044873 RepID=A0ABV9S5K9_9PSEU